ncbi:MAG: hypothetical protein ACO3RT_10980 [Arenicellales bacterium]
MNRRDLLGRAIAGAGLTGVGAFGTRVGSAHEGSHVGLPTSPIKVTSSFFNLEPVEKFRQLMRVQRSLYDEDDILHWYHFTMVAVPLNATPVPVVRWEGIEFSRHQRIGESLYRLHGHNLSFPRDLHSGEFIDRVKNPVTGQVVDVPPMALTEDPGIIRSLEGVVTLDAPQLKPRPELRTIRRENDWVKVDAIRVPPDTWPVTFLEIGTEGVPAALFADPRHLWLPSEVSGAYVFPWPKWMQMGDAPGHMFASWSGCKLRDVSQLPADFVQRAESGYGHLLTVDRSPFARPLS